MDKIKKIHYVYYSFEESGRGYIGYRKCPEGLTPELDTYLGSATDKTFKPISKTILKRNLTQREAIAIEIYFQRKYLVAEEWNKDFANLAYQTSEGFCYLAFGENNPNFGKKWYNNGIEEILFSLEEEIPEGFITGRLEEIKRKLSEANIGEKNPNFGKTGENNSIFGKSVYNNGIETKRFSLVEEIPEGYIMGEREETRKKKSEAVKGKNNPLYGKKCYNNGIEQKYISPDEEIPEGYTLGGLPSSEETKRKTMEANKSINFNRKIRVITHTCCYFSVKDAYKELGISKRKFYKLFEKDSQTGFYMEKSINNKE
jgi:hypothetical protein